MTAPDRHTGQPAIVVGGSSYRTSSRASTRPPTATRRERAADRDRRPAGPDVTSQTGVPAAAPATALKEWHELTGPQRAQAWAELREWTTWLIDRYQLTLESRIPPCWAEHPELIEELWALKAWRNEAYGAEASGQDAVLWHQALIGFLNHVVTYWAKGCRAGHRTLREPVAGDQALTARWAAADPLAGVPSHLRHDRTGKDAAGVEFITEPQMDALIAAGEAHRVRNTDVAVVAYGTGLWVHSRLAEAAPAHPETSTDATAATSTVVGAVAVGTGGWLLDEDLAAKVAHLITTAPDGTPTLRREDRPQPFGPAADIPAPSGAEIRPRPPE